MKWLKNLNPYQSSIALFIETGHLICIANQANQMHGFYIKCNTALQIKCMVFIWTATLGWDGFNCASNTRFLEVFFFSRYKSLISETKYGDNTLVNRNEFASVPFENARKAKFFFDIFSWFTSEFFHLIENFHSSKFFSHEFPFPHRFSLGISAGCQVWSFFSFATIFEPVNLFIPSVFIFIYWRLFITHLSPFNPLMPTGNKSVTHT